MKQIIMILVLCFMVSGCAASLSSLPPSQELIMKLKTNSQILADMSPFMVSYLKERLKLCISQVSMNYLIEIQALVGREKLSEEELALVAAKWDLFLESVSPQVLERLALFLVK